MIKILEKAIAQVAELSIAEQNRAAEMLLAFANQAKFPLSSEQVEGVKIALAQAEQREFASESSVERLLNQTWK